ncbi:MAG TPA: hypothetical protein VJ890_04430 [Vineibacter sp.]|nr:hypothetical protein [Vineibacter sp.]
MMLSVLSGLSRLNVDPWDEAAWLSQQPKEVAIATLAQRIAGMPRGRWQVSEAPAIASRLVDLLPEHTGSAGPAPTRLPASRKKRSVTLLFWLIAAALALSLLFDAPGRVGDLLTGDGSVVPVVTPAP